MKGLEQVLKQADDAIKNLDLDSAISHLNLATVLEMNDPAIWYQLGQVYYCKMQFKETIDCMRIVLENAPHKTQARFILADSMNRLNRFSEAIKALGPELAFNECNLYTKLILGDSYLGLKRYLEAVVQYKSALRLSPPSFDEMDVRYHLVQVKRAILGLIKVYNETGHKDEQQKWLEKYRQTINLQNLYKQS